MLVGLNAVVNGADKRPVSVGSSAAAAAVRDGANLQPMLVGSAASDGVNHVQSVLVGSPTNAPTTVPEVHASVGGDAVGAAVGTVGAPAGVDLQLSVANANNSANSGDGAAHVEPGGLSATQEAAPVSHGSGAPGPPCLGAAVALRGQIN